MNEEDFNYLETEGVYNGKRRYSVKDIMVLQLILYNITGERYNVNGCSSCLEILKSKIKPFYDIEKKQRIENAKPEPKKSIQKRKPRQKARDSE